MSARLLLAKELESLRAQAKTYDGPTPLTCRYLIPFTKRQEFEAAWPHLLKVKAKERPSPSCAGRGPISSPCGRPA